MVELRPRSVEPPPDSSLVVCPGQVADDESKEVDPSRDVIRQLAYLPMIAVLIGSAQLPTNILLPRFGPKFMVATGMVIAAVAMLLLTRIGLHSSYVTAILPTLVILGLGMGQIIAPSASVATVGLASDAGIASAMLNTSQQVGGSVGTSLLTPWPPVGLPPTRWPTRRGQPP